MNVAFLEKVPSTDKRYLLKPTLEVNPGDSTALLKARTLLSFLWGQGLLQSRDAPDGWILMHGPTTTKEQIDTIQLMLSRKSSVSDAPHAVIGMKYGTPSWEQPGIAAIKNDPEIQSIFVNSFLEGSKRWLIKHPDESVALQRAFLKEDVRYLTDIY